MKKVLLLALAALNIASCATPPTRTEPPRPRLVVLLVVDGLPQRQVTDYRDQLAPGGLRRFLDHGAWFADAHYGHARTLTGPGHAAIATGASPSRSGIIANSWRDPRTGELEYCVGDSAARYIGHPTEPLDGTSPRNLKAEAIGDVLKRASPASKVISISAKDRSAILLAGQLGTAYVYQESSGAFASTTHYMGEHPAWVETFNGAHPADRYFGEEWRALLPDAAYGKSLPDGQAWYAAGGHLPRRIGAGLEKPGPAFYQALKGSPFIDALTLDFARAAIRAEGLGGDEVPDILALSLSSHDSVNHGYGPESRVSHDNVLQVDRLLEKFFADLDRAVGADRYLVVLTSDHGFTPAPEYSRALGRQAGRFDARAATARVDAALSRRFGPGRWLLGSSGDTLLLNSSQAAIRNVEMGALAEEARALLLKEPGVVAAYTRAELESGSRAGAPFLGSMRRSWHPERSGEVQMVLQRYWVIGTGKGTTHGSPHPEDTHVPIMWHGRAWAGAGRVDERADVVDIAPTLARVLGLPAPAQSEGRVLPIAGGAR